MGIQGIDRDSSSVCGSLGHHLGADLLQGESVDDSLWERQVDIPCSEARQRGRVPELKRLELENSRKKERTFFNFSVVSMAKGLPRPK